MRGTNLHLAPHWPHACRGSGAIIDWYIRLQLHARLKDAFLYLVLCACTSVCYTFLIAMGSEGSAHQCFHVSMLLIF